MTGGKGKNGKNRKKPEESAGDTTADTTAEAAEQEEEPEEEEEDTEIGSDALSALEARLEKKITKSQNRLTNVLESSLARIEEQETELYALKGEFAAQSREFAVGKRLSTLALDAFFHS